MRELREDPARDPGDLFLHTVFALVPPSSFSLVPFETRTLALLPATSWSPGSVASGDEPIGKWKIVVSTSDRVLLRRGLRRFSLCNTVFVILRCYLGHVVRFLLLSTIGHLQTIVLEKSFDRFGIHLERLRNLLALSSIFFPRIQRPRTIFHYSLKTDF